MKKIILIDNYDSFTFNLYHYLSSLKVNVDVIRNDQITSKEIIKKLKFIKKNDFVVITAGLPFGKAGMTNMVRLYKVGT